MVKVLKFADQAALSRALGDHVHEQAGRAIGERGQFCLLVAGGSVPDLLAGPSFFRPEGQFERWHVYLADERCVPYESSDSNGRLVRETLARGPASKLCLHLIGDTSSPTNAARDYANVISSVSLDLAVLGMGPDGHVGSLFPGKSYPEDLLVLPILDSPKSPPTRITLSYAALARVGSIAFAITNVAKRGALHQAIHDSSSNLPIARIISQRPADATIILTDISDV